MWLAALGSAAAPVDHEPVSFSSAMIEPLEVDDKGSEPNWGWVKRAQRTVSTKHETRTRHAAKLMHPAALPSMIEPMDADTDRIYAKDLIQFKTPGLEEDKVPMPRRGPAVMLAATKLMQLNPTLGFSEGVSEMAQPRSVADDDDTPDWMKEVSPQWVRGVQAVRTRQSMSADDDEDAPDSMKKLKRSWRRATKAWSRMHAATQLVANSTSTEQKWDPKAPIQAPVPPRDDLWISIQEDCGPGAENTSLLSGMHLLHQLDPLKYDEFNASFRMNRMLEDCRDDPTLVNSTMASESQVDLGDLVNHVDCAWYWATNVFGTAAPDTIPGMKPAWWVDNAVSRLQNLKQLSASIEHDDDDLDAGDGLDSNDWAEKQARSIKVSQNLIANYVTATEILLVAHRSEKLDDNTTSIALASAKKAVADIAKQADRRFTSRRCKGGYDAKNCGLYRAVSASTISGWFTARPSSHLDKAYITKVIKFLRDETGPFLLKEPRWDSNSRDVAAVVLTMLKVHNETVKNPKDHNTTLVPTTTLIPITDPLVTGLEQRLLKQTRHVIRATGCRRKITHHVALMDGNYLAARMMGFIKAKLASTYVNGFTQAEITAGASGIVSSMLTANTFSMKDQSSWKSSSSRKE
jgi:hypothetical protein